MKVKVDYSAMLSMKDCGRGDEIEVTPSITVGELMIHLGVKKHHTRFIISSVNGQTVKEGHTLKNGDEIFFLLLAGGG